VPLLTLLAAIGRRGTFFVAASIFVGLAIPGIAAFLRPILGETIFYLLTLAFLRVNPAELHLHFRRPGLIAAAAAWVMLVSPAVLGLSFFALGFQSMSGLYFMLILQIAAPPLMSSPAMAALLGLDVALTLAGLVLCMTLTPLTASSFSHAFLGTSLISPAWFGFVLFCYIAGSFLTATIVRWAVGDARIEANRPAIDGLSVIGLFIFAVAAMDGVTDNFRADPALVVKLTVLAFALTLGMIALTTLVFLRAGRARALSIGIMTGNRNIGLMMAATGFSVPEVAWLYFAVAQFPIYLLPAVLKPLASRFVARR